MADWRDELARVANRLEGLVCVECGRVSPLAFERGWTLRLDCDDELAAFCPDCDRQEFGRA